MDNIISDFLFGLSLLAVTPIVCVSMLALVISSNGQDDGSASAIIGLAIGVMFGLGMMAGIREVGEALDNYKKVRSWRKEKADRQKTAQPHSAGKEVWIK